MKNKDILIRNTYFVLILMMLFTIGLAGMKAVAATSNNTISSVQNKVNRTSDTKDEEIKAPEGISGDGGKWESTTYTPPDEETSNSELIEKPMTSAEEYGAIAAGLIGVLAISASKSGTASDKGIPQVAEGNGIWVPETDRDAVTEMINKAASKEYYIDENGFIKEVEGAVENTNKSSTYSSVLDRLINGNSKVVIGVDDGWVSYGENGFEANAFTGGNSGITIGDNETPQVVIVSGKDTAESSADMTLAHELTHALRGEEGLKSINTDGGINQDEEAHTIEVENEIRKELGYALRKDGDESYGKYNNALEEKDWYNNIDTLQGTSTLSGNPYSNSLLGSVVSAVASVIRSILSSSSSSSSSSSHSSSSSSHSSSSSDYEPVWGTNYDDSVFERVVESVVETFEDFDSESENDDESNWSWDDFWKPITQNALVSNTLSTIGRAIATVTSTILNLPLIQLFNIFSKPKTGWVQEKDGTWYYYDANSIIKTGWQNIDGKWYYFDTSDGKMVSSKWEKGNDGYWYYLGSGGDMATGWVKDKEKWYYLDSEGKMLTGWRDINGKQYFLDYSSGEMRTGWIDSSDGWYYLYSEGHMATGWLENNGKWYYFDKDTGKMSIGWTQDQETGKWYYTNEDGVMQSGWIDGDKYYCYGGNGEMAMGWMLKPGSTDEWYYFDQTSGERKRGWINDDGTFYYLYSDKDTVAKGWAEINGKYYYFDDSGAMQTGWVTDDDGKYYYLYSDGSMATGWMQQGDKWYYFDSNGQWVPPEEDNDESNDSSNPQDGDNGDQSAWNDEIMNYMKGTPMYQWFLKETRDGNLHTFFDYGGFYRDEDGVYHAKQDGWQQYAGYNDLYDDGFDLACNMDKKKFEFETDSGKYMIWLWKGDYLNLGAGAEAGIYYDGGPHWLCDTEDSMPMTLSLKDEQGNTIFDWNPQDKNWWCTGFNPESQDAIATNLTASGSIDFSDHIDMWDAFYNKNHNDSMWNFDENTHIATYKW